MKLMNFVKNGGWKDALGGLVIKIATAKPEILLVAGSLSVLAGTVYACTKTEEAKKAIKETKEESEKIEKELVPAEGTDEKQLKIEKGKRYVASYAILAYKMLKIYGVPALLWFGGMGMIFGSHGELRKTNKHLVADGIAAKKLFDEYRERVAKAVGEETEKKIYMGAQEGMVNVLEIDEKTGEKKIVAKKCDVFHAQPGSIFARNFNEETCDAFDGPLYSDEHLDLRINAINLKLETGVARAYTGMDILRMLGYTENALGEDENIDALIRNGISSNARKVPDPEMRKLKVTRLRGYRKIWDEKNNMEIWIPTLRLDFNFYPLEGHV